MCWGLKVQRGKLNEGRTCPSPALVCLRFKVEVFVDDGFEFLPLDAGLPPVVELGVDPHMNCLQAGVVFGKLDAEMLLDQED